MSTVFNASGGFYRVNIQALNELGQVCNYSYLYYIHELCCVEDSKCPPPPTSVRCHTPWRDVVQLSWTDVPGNDGYVIRLDVNEGCDERPPNNQRPYSLYLPRPSNSNVYIYSGTTGVPANFSNSYRYYVATVCADGSLSEFTFGGCVVNGLCSERMIVGDDPKGLGAFPNPTTGEINLAGLDELADANGQLSVELTDASGTVVRKGMLVTGQAKSARVFDVSGLRVGIYFLTARTDEGPVTERIVVADR